MGDSSDDERSAKAAPKKEPRNINQILRKALEEASTPGEGDAEPEVLEAPGGREVHGRDSAAEEEEKRERQALLEKQRLIFEEERRVAELSFDPHAVLPCERMDERAKYIPLRLSYEGQSVRYYFCI
jgi:hypothetical protein